MCVVEVVCVCVEGRREEGEEWREEEGRGGEAMLPLLLID